MITRCVPMLGTFVEITVPERAARALDAAFAAIAHVHRRMSFHAADSDLARLRAAPAGAVVALDPATVAVLRLALGLHEESGGLFDVAIGRQLVRGGFLPRAGIGRLEDFAGTSADITILSDRHVRIARRVLIDLGGIAKGHAVDLGAAALHEAGAECALVNAGGDLAAFGPRDWEVGLRDADGAVRQALRIGDCALASSANLLARKRRGGALHTPHIGRDGRPVLAAGRVSVLAPTCALADAMTKVALADPALARRMLAPRGGSLLESAPAARAA